jgi:hypothetical protein
MGDGVFTLTGHLEKNLTKHESDEEIALHFAKISQEYPPLEPKKLHTDVKSKILIESEDFGLMILMCITKSRRQPNPSQGSQGTF